jgi:sRNA-binding regulator protein Hfq
MSSARDWCKDSSIKYVFQNGNQLLDCVQPMDTFINMVKEIIKEELVAKETITYFGDIVGTKVYELGEKE